MVILALDEMLLQKTKEVSFIARVDGCVYQQSVHEGLTIYIHPDIPIMTKTSHSKVSDTTGFG